LGWGLGVWLAPGDSCRRQGAVQLLESLWQGVRDGLQYYRCCTPPFSMLWRIQHSCEAGLPGPYGGHVDAAHALRSSKKGGGIAHFVHPTVRCYRRAEQTRGYGTLGPGSVDPQCQNYPPHSTLPACSRGSTVHKLTAVRQLAKTVVSGRIGTK
jgi:hypothetical protein